MTGNDDQTEAAEPRAQQADADGPFDQVGALILAEMLALVPFDGWTARALGHAAKAAGIDAATVHAAFPRGVADVMRAWSRSLDREMLAAMASPEFKTLKIREKVAFAVQARLSAIRPHKEAARRLAATLALPIHGAIGPKLVWATADTIWRGLGDKSTDFNFYSKRTILSGVWVSTFAHWLSDESDDEKSTRAFLDARIENVMQIEKFKGEVRKLDIDPTKPIEWLARLRYPAR